ncbi:hypothetical protein [Streptomyces monomycini]|uniref:hypothetical protein n=1 Tax=Streptomyces monomycini TaxID=371720 RepID=UPI0007C5B020|nr:hypothetical protein [Streptomyces monomycini]
MSLTLIIVPVVALLVIAALVLMARAKVARSGSRGLRRRFGPEYERAVAVHDGDTAAAERELNQRLDRHGAFRPTPLTAELRLQYEERWEAVQRQFVDEPEQAVVEADLLIGRLARERGYPADTYDEQTDALSVHHAQGVHDYRKAHETAVRARNNRPENAAGTEELRAAVVHARALFTELLEAGTGRSASHGHRDHGPRNHGPRDHGRGGTAHGRTDPARDGYDGHDPSAARSGTQHHEPTARRLGDRLRAPWTHGRGHGHDTAEGGAR